jgi:hypothetical protein
VSDDEPIEDVLRRAAEELRGFAEDATIQLRLIGVGKAGAKRAYSFQIKPHGARLQAELTTDPDLVISTGAETFRHLAAGSYSPVQAYLDGRMHLRGNVGLGKRMLVHLAGSGTDFEGCLSLEMHWQPPSVKGKALGTLTGVGRNFTPGGRYEVHFDFGQVDPPPLAIGFADASGQFSFTATLECDSNGVDILADDIETGDSLDFHFAIPCLT